MYALYHPEKKEFVFVGITEDSYDSLMVEKVLITQSEKPFIGDQSSLFVSETKSRLIELMDSLNIHYIGNGWSYYGKAIGDYICGIEDLEDYVIVEILCEPTSQK